MKKRIGIISAVLSVSMLAGCGAKPSPEESDLGKFLDDSTITDVAVETEETQETSDTFNIRVMTSKYFEGYEATGTKCDEEKLENAMTMAGEEGEGDFANYMEGYETSSMKGQLSLYRKQTAEDKVVYDIQENGATVITTPEFDSSMYSYHYFQVADMDHDSIEEILVADYVPTTAIFAVGQFYVYKKSQGEWKLFAARSCDGQGNADVLLESRSEYADARIDDVALVEDGLRVIVDRGTKINGMFYPEEHELMIAQQFKESENTFAQSEAFLKKSLGTYKYENCALDGKSGKLIITEDEYDYISIADFTGDTVGSYRFMTNNTHCEKIDGNKMYIANKLKDDTEYYIFEQNGEGLNVYYDPDSFDKAELMYSAVRCSGDELALSQKELEELSQLLSSPEFSSLLTAYDTTDNEVRCLSGFKSGPYYSVKVEKVNSDRAIGNKSVVCLANKTQGFELISNHGLWQEDETDKVFDVALSQFPTSLCSIYCFEGGYALLTVDGQAADHAEATCEGRMMDISSVEAKDVNGDGYEDIVIKGTVDGQECESTFIFDLATGFFKAQ